MLVRTTYETGAARSTTTILLFRECNRTAVASPIPEEPPVMRIVLLVYEVSELFSIVKVVVAAMLTRDQEYHMKSTRPIDVKVFVMCHSFCSKLTFDPCQALRYTRGRRRPAFDAGESSQAKWRREYPALLKGCFANE
jgi:hypothetical protein